MPAVTACGGRIRRKKQGLPRADCVRYPGGGKRERTASIPEKGTRDPACYPARFSLKKIVRPVQAEGNRTWWNRCTGKNNIPPGPFSMMLSRETVV